MATITIRNLMKGSSAACKSAPRSTAIPWKPKPAFFLPHGSKAKRRLQHLKKILAVAFESSLPRSAAAI
jgi:hypothetical protein